MQVDEICILIKDKNDISQKQKNISNKLLVKIKNKTILDHLLAKIIKYNFKKIYLLCSYKKEYFKKLYHKKKIHNSTIYCVDIDNNSSLFESLLKLKKIIKKNFIFIDGKKFVDFNFFDLINFDLKKNFAKICFLKKKKNFLKNYLVNFKNFNKKKFINSGIFLFNKNIFNFLEKRKNFNMFEIFQSLIYKKKLIGRVFEGNSTDIDLIIKSTNKIKKFSLLENKVLFLDRDGVINKLVGYVLNYKKFKFLPGVKKAIKYANKKKYLVIIITNQSAIGRSWIKEKDLKKIHHHMQKDMYNYNGAYIDDIYFSPYYKKSKVKKYTLNKNDRKPGNGMFIKAFNKWNTNIKSSLFIGDQNTDKYAAKSSKIKFYFKKNYSLYKQLKLII